MEWIVKEIDFCFVGMRYEKTYPIVTISIMAMTRKSTEIPLEFVRTKIPPNLPLLKGGVIIPPFVKGDGGRLFVTDMFFNLSLPASSNKSSYQLHFVIDF